MAELPYLVDPSTEKLRNLLVPGALGKGERFVLDNLQPIVDRAAACQSTKRLLEVAPIEASEILEKAMNGVTEELRRWADGYSVNRWLWMLRRLPPVVFAGRLLSTIGYDTTLAEVIAGRSSCSRLETSHEPNGRFAYSLDGAVIQRLSRFCAGIRFLSHLHVYYRWAAKGATCIFEKGELVRRKENEDLTEAVRIYDARVERSSYPLSRMGTVVAAPNEFDRSEQLLWLSRVFPYEGEVPLPGIDPLSAKENDFGIVEANFTPLLLGLERLSTLLQDRRTDSRLIFTQPIAALVFLLWAAPLLVRRHYAGFFNLLKVGYLTWAIEDRVRTDLTDAYSVMPALVKDILIAAGLNSLDEVLYALEGIAGGERPLVAGPIVFRNGGVLSIDLHAASQALDAELEFPATEGRIANVRGDHFEDVVQSIIDQSEWAPGGKLRSFRQKKLKQDGKDLTDFDAIGERGQVALLVSCKSTVYSRLYDMGDYRIVRNTASLVQNAVTYWRQILTRLRENPTGSNFDLSGYKDLIGVVCTPNVVFVNAETARLTSAEGLGGTVSLAELASWLGLREPFWLRM